MASQAAPGIAVDSISPHGRFTRVSFHVRPMTGQNSFAFSTGGWVDQAVTQSTWRERFRFSAGYANADSVITSADQSIGGPSIRFTAGPGTSGPPEWVDLPAGKGTYRLRIVGEQETLQSAQFSL